MIWLIFGAVFLALFVLLLLLPRLSGGAVREAGRLSERLDPLIPALAALGLSAAVLFKSVLLMATLTLALWLFNRKRKEIAERKRQEMIEAQFVQFLEFLSALFSATGDLIGSMDRAAENVKDPLASEIRATVREYRATNRLRQALEGLSERLPVWSVRFFVRSVLEAEAYGADVSTVVQPIIRTLQDRATLRNDLKNEIRSQQATVVTLLIMLPGMLGMSLFIVPNALQTLSGTLFGQIIVASIPLVEYGTWALFNRLETEVSV